MWGGRAHYSRENALAIDLQEFQKLSKRGFSFIEGRKPVERTGCAEVRRKGVWPDSRSQIVLPSNQPTCKGVMGLYTVSV